MHYKVGDVIRCEGCGRGAKITSVEGKKIEFKLLDKGGMPGQCSRCRKLYCPACMLEADNKCPNCAAHGSFNLFGKLVSIDYSTSSFDANSWLAICELCKADQDVEIALVLDKFPELVTKKDENGLTLLHTAALSDALATSTLLLDRGAEIEAADNEGNTPLIWATSANHERLVQLFLCRGANAQAAAKNGVNPIFLAATEGRGNLLKELLKYGAPVDQCGGIIIDETTLSITPLQVAVLNGHTESVRILAGGGADVNRGDPLLGMTSMIMAVTAVGSGVGTIETIKELHRHGADVNGRNREGDTPLSVANEYNLKFVANTLRELGAKDPV